MLPPSSTECASAAGSVFAAYRSNFTTIRTSATIYTVANGAKATCS